ncbi:CCDC90 family protein [Paracoccus onubensis]|uniref:DUF1640 domain-containing protein n=1 Tax=Paracoccus onubensis TaxID=1675788 RepID=A0A418SWL7_9RHOB|nr:coiled-coil domain-containing protein [Paracoccus onubensis]RJE85354.1 DUF1640 domain-containing protein [Paracoccus onubensis]
MVARIAGVVSLTQFQTKAPYSADRCYSEAEHGSSGVMNALNIDTLKLSRKLTAAGLEPAAAEAIAEVIRDVDTDDLATRQDLQTTEQRLKQDIFAARGDLQQEISELRSGLLQDFSNFKIEIQQDFSVFRSEMQQENAAFRSEMQQENAAFRNELQQGNAAFRNELRQESSALRSELHQEIAAVRADMRDMENRLVIKMGGMIVGSLAILTALMRMMPPG